MRIRFALIAGLPLAVLSLAGCSFEPKYVRPEAPVPPSWPVGDAYLRQSEASLPSLAYTDVFRDARLRKVIGEALDNNRDLRVAAANIASARAQYRIQRANLLPLIGATAGVRSADTGGSGVTAGGGASVSGVTTVYTANVGTTSFEIDLFGRLRSLNHQALNLYFATESAARATRLALVGDVATAWLNYAADRSQLRISEETAASAGRSVELTRALYQGGLAPRSDVSQAEQVLAQAQADIASGQTAVAQDANALQLLVGAPVDPALLPEDGIEPVVGSLAMLPAGLDSHILLRRPDVVQAEYQLRAANAQIGAARAALFPSISLTGAAGFASTALGDLFTGGAFSWSVAPSAQYAIFSGGAARAGVAQARAEQQAAVATYEKAVQTAFREVSDALARAGTIDAQQRANVRLADAAEDAFRLADARYRGGLDTYLNSLDAQRTLYGARQALVTTILARGTNLVNLYVALGGDSRIEATPQGPQPAVAAASAP